MSKFKIGDQVSFKNPHGYAPNAMTVGKIHPQSLYCECFYFTENRTLQVGEFHEDLLSLVDESEESSTTTMPPYVGH
jgi:hypothetical protein